MTAAWAIAVVIVTFALQALMAFVMVGTSTSGLAQGAVGIIVLWFALGLRPEMPTRRHVLLSLLGVVPFWGTLVSIAVELFLEHRETQEQSDHL